MRNVAVSGLRTTVGPLTCTVHCEIQINTVESLAICFAGLMLHRTNKHTVGPHANFEH